MSTSPFHVQDEAPVFEQDRTESEERGNFSQEMRDLPEVGLPGCYLRVPKHLEIGSVRTMAYERGKTAQPEPRKYSVRKDVNGVFWVFWRHYRPDEEYPAGREDTRVPVETGAEVAAST